MSGEQATAVDLVAERGPGLKPLESIGFIRGAEAPRSLRKGRGGDFEGERGGGSRGVGDRGPSLRSG